MKNRIAFSLTFLITGLLLAIGPQTLFKVCETTKMVMKCHWAARAEIGVGIILISAAILYFVLDAFQTKLAISFLSAVTYVNAILLTTVLIGGCSDAGSACKQYAYPIINTISGFGIIASGVNIAYLIRQVKKDQITESKL